MATSPLSLTIPAINNSPNPSTGTDIYIPAHASTPASVPPTSPAIAAKAKVSFLDRKENYWTAYHLTWFRLGLLLRAGDEIYQYAYSFLYKRDKESPDLYTARTLVFHYSPYIAQAIEWYISYLFKRNPEITYHRRGMEDTFRVLPATRSALIAPPQANSIPKSPSVSFTTPPSSSSSSSAQNQLPSSATSPNSSVPSDVSVSAAPNTDSASATGPTIPPTTTSTNTESISPNSSQLPPAPIVPLKTVTIMDGIDPKETSFYLSFRSNCDRAGTSFDTFFRRVVQSCLVNGSFFILTDLPKLSPGDPVPLNRADDKRLGLDAPYLCGFEPDEVINYTVDRQGNLTTAVIKRVISRAKSSTPPGTPPWLTEYVNVEQWWTYDQTNYYLYERESDGQSSDEATLVDSGPHALASQHRCPVRRLGVPDGLWFGRRILLVAVKLLNYENQLTWLIIQCAVPWLLITGAKEPKAATRSEVTGLFFQEAAARASYLEPGSTSIGFIAQQLETTKEELYQLLHLKAEGRSSAATPAVQSGVAKQLDMTPSREVCTEIGNYIRQFEKLVLMDVCDARGDDFDADIIGYNYEDSGLEFLLDEQIKMSAVALPSPSFWRKRMKILIQSAIKDASPSDLEIYFKEIDTNATDEFINALIAKIQPAQGVIRTGGPETVPEEDEI